MDPLWVALGVAALMIGALVVALRRRGAEAARLRGQLQSATRDLEQLQQSFSRFAPAEIVERVIAGGVTAHGERKQVTALFADLVGYTALSDSVDPSLLVHILNGYFERMSRAITENRGHVSTFIGDGILALFGAVDSNPWQVDDAVHAALAMRAELEDYNRELGKDGLPELGIGVGLHRGTGVAGLVGSRERMEYAFVGRTVNLAARVQDLTRQHPTDILITRAVQEGLDRRFVLRELPAAEVRGIAGAVEIFAVEGFDEPRRDAAG
jgi:adenylate cyclase